jgi:protocatechuate 3,4-dioxygenase beta subunit
VPLARGGVLTGTILDDTQEPAIGVPVRVYRRVWRSGERAFQPAGTGMTDDRGVYRISALTPGDYLVSVTPAGVEVSDFAREGTSYREVVAALQSTGSANTEFRTMRRDPDDPAQSEGTPASGFATVYYPNAMRASEAVSLPVAAGEEHAGVDFQLRRLPIAGLTGTLVGPDGPAAGAMVQLVDHAQVPGVGVRTTRTGADGRFSFGAVPAGQYSLIARATARGARPLEASAREAAEFLASARDNAQAASIAAALAGAAPLWATVDVLAEDGKPADVQMTLQPGLSISGRVAFEGGNGPPSNLTRMSLTVMPVGVQRTKDAHEPPPAAVDAAGRFTIRGVVPGRYTIAVAAGAPDGFVLRSAIFEGRDVVDIPFEIGSLDQASGVIVTFTTRVSSLGGAVQDASGQPAFGTTVIAFPNDELLWTPVTRRIQAVRAGSEGRYVFRNIPPGDYRLAVVAEVEPGQWFNPEFLRGLSGSVTVTITEGGTHSQELRVK